MGSGSTSGSGGRLKQAIAAGGVSVLRAIVDAVGPGTGGDEAAPPERAPEPFSWGRVVKEVRKRIKEDNVPFLAAGLAYYGMLALIPGLIAAVSLYGLIAEPQDVLAIADDLAGAVPEEVQVFIEGQLTSIIDTSATSLSVSLAISILGTIWAASNGTKALISGVNLAFGSEEKRSPLKLRLFSIALTFGLLLSVGALLAVITVGNQWLSGAGWVSAVLGYGRWLLMLLAVMALLAALYRIAPVERPPDWQMASLGGVVAALGWVAASFGLSVYVSRFGSFNETYGTLGAVIVVLLWLFVSSFIVLLGAVIDASIGSVRRASADA